jgi:hypothetical protein
MPTQIPAGIGSGGRMRQRFFVVPNEIGWVEFGPDLSTTPGQQGRSEKYLQQGLGKFAFCRNC